MFEIYKSTWFIEMMFINIVHGVGLIMSRMNVIREVANMAYVIEYSSKSSLDQIL